MGFIFRSFVIILSKICFFVKKKNFRADAFQGRTCFKFYVFELEKPCKNREKYNLQRGIFMI